MVKNFQCLMSSSKNNKKKIKAMQTANPRRNFLLAYSVYFVYHHFCLIFQAEHKKVPLWIHAELYLIHNDLKKHTKHLEQDYWKVMLSEFPSLYGSLTTLILLFLSFIIYVSSCKTAKSINYFYFLSAAEGLVAGVLSFTGTVVPFVSFLVAAVSLLPFLV